MISFLSNPAVYPEAPEKVEIVQTHISIVAIAKPYVYKIKKTVDFGFVNYMSLEKRFHFCRRELELNSRLSEGVYLDVVPIYDNGGAGVGGGAFQGGLNFFAGEVVDYAVKMKYLDPKTSLLCMNAKRELNENICFLLAGKLREFYDGAAAVQNDSYFANLRNAALDNLPLIENFDPPLAPSFVFTFLGRYLNDFLNKNRALIEGRMARGRVRDCHGDLRLEHIYFDGSAIDIIDAIEFNDEFRQIDILNDAAFLLMDLDLQRSSHLGAHIFQSLFGLGAADNEPQLLNFFKIYRALVRAKVNVMKAAEAEVPRRERESAIKKARRFLYLSLYYATGLQRPMAFIFMGKVASGKSSLARPVSAAFGCKYFSSDKIRKDHFGLRRQESGPEQKEVVYSQQSKDLIYEIMERRAMQALKAGRPVVLDATYGSPHKRGAFIQKLQAIGIGYLFVEVVCSDEVRKARLRGRLNGDSDARLADMPHLDSLYTSPGEVDKGHVVKAHTGEDLEHTLFQLLRNLS